MMPEIPIHIPREQMHEFCIRWNVKELSLFGSVLRNDFGPTSDVDVLVSFSDVSGMGLWEFLDMKEELEAMFGREVDLVDFDALRNPYRKREIRDTREIVYAA